jgi:predicted RNase H-like HicB family nuclease
LSALGHYSYFIFWHSGDDCYFAVSPEWPRLSAFGDTPEEALAEFQIVLNAAIEVHQDEKWPLPEPEPPSVGDAPLHLTDAIAELGSRNFERVNMPPGAVAVAGAGMIFDDD